MLLFTKLLGVQSSAKINIIKKCYKVLRITPFSDIKFLWVFNIYIKQTGRLMKAIAEIKLDTEQTMKLE